MSTFISNSISKISITSELLSDVSNVYSNENRGKSIKSGLKHSLDKRTRIKSNPLSTPIDMDIYEDDEEAEEEEIEHFCQFPPRSHYSNSVNRPATRRSINPIQSRLIANLVVKYQHLSQFQAFMERYHCFPYVTEFKFPINMWINEHLEHKKQESDDTNLEQDAQSNKVDENHANSKEEEEESLEPKQFSSRDEEYLPSLEEEEESACSNSDSDEGEQIEESNNDVFIVGQEEEGRDQHRSNHESSDIIHGEIEQDIDSISNIMSMRNHDCSYLFDSHNNGSDNTDDDDDNNKKPKKGPEPLVKTQPRQLSLKKIKDFIGLLKYDKSVYVIQD